MVFSVSEENWSDPSNPLVVSDADSGGERNKNKVQTIIVTDDSESFYV